MFRHRITGSGAVRTGITLDLEKKAEVERVSIVKKEKSVFLGIQNGYGFSNYFVRKMRSIKSRKGSNRKNGSRV